MQGTDKNTPINVIDSNKTTRIQAKEFVSIVPSRTMEMHRRPVLSLPIGMLRNSRVHCFVWLLDLTMDDFVQRRGRQNRWTFCCHFPGKRNKRHIVSHHLWIWGRRSTEWFWDFFRVTTLELPCHLSRHGDAQQSFSFFLHFSVLVLLFFLRPCIFRLPFALSLVSSWSVLPP